MQPSTDSWQISSFYKKVGKRLLGAYDTTTEDQIPQLFGKIPKGQDFLFEISECISRLNIHSDGIISQ